MTNAEPTDCLHGMERAWCSICRKADGYRPGSTRQENDCTVVAFTALTGADYAEAEQITADHGRRPGKGMTVEALHAALASVSFVAQATSKTIPQAVADGGTFHVTAERRGKRHSWAIVNGEQINAWSTDRGSFRYRVFSVA